MSARLQDHQLRSLREKGEPPVAPKPKRKRDNEESRIQKSCRRWWDSVCRNHWLDCGALYAVPNGATLGDKYTAKIRASILKDEGLRPGHPDMNLDVMRGGYGGMRIELKKPGEGADAGQKAYHQEIRARGYKVEVCTSLHGFICIVSDYLALTPPDGGRAREP